MTKNKNGYFSKGIASLMVLGALAGCKGPEPKSVFYSPSGSNQAYQDGRVMDKSELGLSPNHHELRIEYGSRRKR